MPFLYHVFYSKETHKYLAILYRILSDCIVKKKYLHFITLWIILLPIKMSLLYHTVPYYIIKVFRHRIVTTDNKDNKPNPMTNDSKVNKKQDKNLHITLFFLWCESEVCIWKVSDVFWRWATESKIVATCIEFVLQLLKGSNDIMTMILCESSAVLNIGESFSLLILCMYIIVTEWCWW